MSGVVWFVRDYVSRHRNPWNRALHLVGVPLAPGLFLYLLVRRDFRRARSAFVAGYALQLVGNRIEGNELGEWALLQSLVRRARSRGGRRR